MISLEARLRERRDAGKKLLVPYLTGGVREDWLDIVRACSLAGSDAIEIGVPFSDPVMDGPVIQAASVQALERGATPVSVLNELAATQFDVPLAVMTYVNLVFRFGYERFASTLQTSGVSGVILPDLPSEEAADWFAAADKHDIEAVLLVAPNTPDDRLQQIAARSKGFVYCIGMLGVTGERTELAASAALIGKRVKAVTDTPALVGIGISTPAQAAEAAAACDGVIVGSALMRRVMQGESPEQIGEFMSSLRTALDAQ